MKVWEIREKYSPEHYEGFRRSTGMHGFKDESYEKGYECGFEEGYKEAMEKAAAYYSKK